MEKVTLSGMLFAIGLILPFFIGQIPAVGKMAPAMNGWKHTNESEVFLHRIDPGRARSEN